MGFVKHDWPADMRLNPCQILRAYTKSGGRQKWALAFDCSPYTSHPGGDLFIDIQGLTQYESIPKKGLFINSTAQEGFF